MEAAAASRNGWHSLLEQAHPWGTPVAAAADISVRVGGGDVMPLEQLVAGVYAWLELPGGIGRANGGVVVDEDAVTVIDTLMVRRSGASSAPPSNICAGPCTGWC
jgi:hypothetical protein